MNILYDRTKETLEAARDRYGFGNQILVAIEELNELSCIIAKYSRFETHQEALAETRDKVLKECGDVLNALDHVQAIFEIKDEEMVEAAAKKMDRVRHWLLNSDSQAISAIDREIPERPCSMCISNGGDPFKMPCVVCYTKPGYKGFKAKVKL